MPDPQPLLEAVPNISVGRDAAMVDAICSAVREACEQGGAHDDSRASLVDVHRDADHDRSVLTLIGRGEALAAGLAALARECVGLLDIHAGHGVHPRIGVLDVVPIVALEDSDPARAAAHALARRVGTFVGEQCDVPVVRYGLDEDGAPIAGASRTGEVRRGGPAGVADRIASGELELLAGPTKPHPTAGVTICGVRDVLVAFNVLLDVDDLELARELAAQIRATADGPGALPGVRTLGLRLARLEQVQVSTNVEQHAVCGPARVLETVARLASERGARVDGAELVGLAPASALAALRYACTRLGVPLSAAAQPSLDAHLTEVL